MGYGKRALQQLAEYYSGNIPCLDEHNDEETEERANGKASLQTETIAPR